MDREQEVKTGNWQKTAWSFGPTMVPLYLLDEPGAPVRDCVVSVRGKAYWLYRSIDNGTDNRLVYRRPATLEEAERAENALRGVGISTRYAEAVRKAALKVR